MKKLRYNGCSIEDMESLLNQIADFKNLVKTTHNATDPGFIQECRLFKQYVKWVSEDLTLDSYICNLPDEPETTLSHRPKNRH
ncbi:hypothetical protein MNBD_GAMMA11-884 [hydrothermal vent metagenome]|uniref:Uncharacterized protein n=1 Tax=hydrothermal vent metagenome TaxID=652676 RepID=A0A3B0X6G4_9ZZZZ